MSDSSSTSPASGDENPQAEAPVNDEEGTTKPGGEGENGTIPSDPDGVAAGYTGEKSTFEPEEDQA